MVMRRMAPRTCFLPKRLASTSCLSSFQSALSEKEPEPCIPVKRHINGLLASQDRSGFFPNAYSALWFHDEEAPCFAGGNPDVRTSMLRRVKSRLAEKFEIALNSPSEEEAALPEMQAARSKRQTVCTLSVRVKLSGTSWQQ
ncbi:MAG TPA: hypothetical protein VIL88_01850 [Devosia sp.]|jgi:hypothetical protein|uniref:hypothetical protein n=1 Tax=Devosia sp. TaxID=1871048 RepID=UPI002F933A39